MFTFIAFAMLHLFCCQAVTKDAWLKINKSLTDFDFLTISVLFDANNGDFLYGADVDKDYWREISLEFAKAIDNECTDECFKKGEEGDPKDIKLINGVLDMKSLYSCMGAAKNKNYIIVTEYECESDNNREALRSRLQKAVDLLD